MADELIMCLILNVSDIEVMVPDNSVVSHVVIDMKRRSKHRPQVYKSYTYMQQIEEHDLFKAIV